MIKVDGREFKDILDACKFYDVNPLTVDYRLNKGWSLTEAFFGRHYDKEYTYIKKLSKKDKITVNGVQFNSIEEAVGYDVESLHKVLSRLRAGWTPDEAFDIVPKKQINPNSKSIEVDGVMYESVASAARNYGLKPSTVSSRLRLGWTIDEAFGLVERKGK